MKASRGINCKTKWPKDMAKTVTASAAICQPICNSTAGCPDKKHDTKDAESVNNCVVCTANWRGNWKLETEAATEIEIAIEIEAQKPLTVQQQQLQMTLPLLLALTRPWP